MKEPKKGEKYYALWHDDEIFLRFIEEVYNTSYRNTVVYQNRRGRTKKCSIPKDELKKLVDEGMSKAKIAKHFGVHSSTIYKYMQEYGIPRDGRDNSSYLWGMK